MMLDKRLLAISEMIVRGKSLADIGTDHAYLPIYLVQNGMVPFAVAADIAEGPYIRAVREVRKAGLEDKIEVRKGDGLKVLARGEVCNIVVAGMGGETIASMLEEDWEKAASFQHFVFQPMSRPESLRYVLAEKGWPILDERVVEENKRFFVIISSKPGSKPYSLSPLEAEIGPIILRTKEYFAFLRYYWKKYKSIEQELCKSKGEYESELLIAYKEKIKALEEVLNGQG